MGKVEPHLGSYSDSQLGMPKDDVEKRKAREEKVWYGEIGFIRCKGV